MEAKASTRKKRTVFAALAILAIGIAPLVNSLGNPHLAGLRGPDVLQLIAIGFCVGLALGMFLVGFPWRARVVVSISVQFELEPFSFRVRCGSMKSP